MPALYEKIGQVQTLAPKPVQYLSFRQSLHHFHKARMKTVSNTAVTNIHRLELYRDLNQTDMT